MFVLQCINLFVMPGFIKSVVKLKFALLCASYLALVFLIQSLLCSEYMNYVVEALELEDTIKNFERRKSTGWCLLNPLFYIVRSEILFIFQIAFSVALYAHIFSGDTFQASDQPDLEKQELFWIQRVHIQSSFAIFPFYGLILCCRMVQHYFVIINLILYSLETSLLSCCVLMIMHAHIAVSCFSWLALSLKPLVKLFGSLFWLSGCSMFYSFLRIDQSVTPWSI